MKRVLMLLSALLLIGCAKEEAKEYYINDLATICNSIEEQVAGDLDRMSEEELYGRSEDESQQELYYLKMTNSLKDKYLSNYDMKKNLRIRVSGTLSYINSTDDGELLFRLAQIKNDQDPLAADLLCATSDQTFLSVEEGTYILIEGFFYKKDRKKESISDCTLIWEEK